MSSEWDSKKTEHENMVSKAADLRALLWKKMPEAQGEMISCPYSCLVYAEKYIKLLEKNQVQRAEQPTSPCPFNLLLKGRSVSYGTLDMSMIANLEKAFNRDESRHIVEWLEYELTHARKKLKEYEQGPGMKKKFILFAGTVKSMHDNNIHPISARRLRELYKLEKEECILVEEGDERTLDRFNKGEFIMLTPRYKGDYEEHLKRVLR